jgi:hypothetical protein
VGITSYNKEKTSTGVKSPSEVVNIAELQVMINSEGIKYIKKYLEKNNKIHAQKNFN